MAASNGLILDRDFCLFFSYLWVIVCVNHYLISEVGKSGMCKPFLDATPTHYTVKIELFSRLKNFCKEDPYESREFEAGRIQMGLKVSIQVITPTGTGKATSVLHNCLFLYRKLVLYPDGNKRRNVYGHISLYLEIAGTNLFQPGWEVHVDFRLFLLDQHKRVYLVFEGIICFSVTEFSSSTNKMCFNGDMPCAAGFDKLIRVKDFTDDSNGYLVDDTCVFGADVFVCKERRTGKGECLSRIQNPSTYKYVWKIDNFLKTDAVCHCSGAFSAGNQKWKIELYPKGINIGKGSHVSLFFKLADPETLPPGSKIYADCTLRIQDQIHFKHYHGRGEKSGQFMWQSGNGFLVNDTCIVEAEVTVSGITRAL
ncbi:putative ubiquitinyl hydrolase 1 [Rosa chinensis]|uniref:Putative ubiquitinyl hydrolase 1 n=1 Tax=Rosa chinensis TaxID=74649 RepID=A0A2P6QZJ0_ROSCH|nr:putative ubiquitinyl hydrolase 1 [Rosa chinensis]